MEHGYGEFVRIKSGDFGSLCHASAFSAGIQKGTASCQLKPRWGESSPSFLKKIVSGFTLIEILIVMLIISIISSVAVMTISFNPQKKIENAANSLASTITLAAEEAMLRPATLGLAFSENSYTFYIYETPKKEDGNPWKQLSSKTFHRHTLPKGAEISLKVQDQNVQLNGKPQIIIAESGDFTPFTLTIKKSGDKPLYQIHGNTNGEVITELLHEK